MPVINQILLTISTLLLVSVVASKATSKFGVPILLLFLFIGMLTGSEGIGGIQFEEPWLAQFIGVVALIFILFAGGLDTDLQAIKKVFWSGLSLATLGVIITAVTIGIFAHFVLGFSPLSSFLLGSIVSSTDAAAVFTLVVNQKLSLKNDLTPLLEFESGSNDPMAVFLVMTTLQLIEAQQISYLWVLATFLKQFIIGASLGYFAGKLMSWSLNKIQLSYNGLYPVFLLALTAFTYSATIFFDGSGFLAVYVAGLILGNESFPNKRNLIHFQDGISWLMQIVMFLSLGLLVFPSELISVMSIGVTLSMFLIIVARPLSVFIAMLPSKLGFREQLFISWVGLRGAVPIVLATFPLIANISEAKMIFNLVFFTVLCSVLIQGTTTYPLAKLLKLSEEVKT